MRRLRVLNLGMSTPLRSQACYHGIAEAMQPDDDAVLILTRPSARYLSLGLHQDANAELDLEQCHALGLSVIRRHTGGGSVLLGPDQLFFHFITPHRHAPQAPRDLYPWFIEPISRCYQRLGIAAHWVAPNDIQVAGRKIGGTGAARINHASVLVGSFLGDFDHDLMAHCIRAPSPEYRQWYARAMTSHMTTLCAQLGRLPNDDELIGLLFAEITPCLGLEPQFDLPRAHELAAIAEWEAELGDPDWLHQPGRKAVAHGVKIAWGIYLSEIQHQGYRVLLLQHHGRIGELLLKQEDTSLDALAQALCGVALEPQALLAAIIRHGGMTDTEAVTLCEALLAGRHQES